MGKARKYFEQWYRTKERGLAAGLQDMRLIASAAFNEGVRFAEKSCNTQMHMDSKKVDVTYMCMECLKTYSRYELAERCCQ